MSYLKFAMACSATLLLQSPSYAAITPDIDVLEYHGEACSGISSFIREFDGGFAIDFYPDREAFKASLNAQGDPSHSCYAVVKITMPPLTCYTLDEFAYTADVLITSGSVLVTRGIPISMKLVSHGWTPDMLFHTREIDTILGPASGMITKRARPINLSSGIPLNKCGGESRVNLTMMNSVGRLEGNDTSSWGGAVKFSYTFKTKRTVPLYMNPVIGQGF